MRDKLIDLITIGITRYSIQQASSNNPDMAAIIADVLIENDYCKASEVAREIFEEIEHTARAAIILLKFEKDEKLRNTKTECYTDLIGYIAELKKEIHGKREGQWLKE